MQRVKACRELEEMSILYVEDEGMIRDSFSYILKRYVKDFHIAIDGKDGLEKFKQHRVDIVISDIMMPRLNGLDMSKKIKEIDESQHIVLTTAFGDIEYLKRAIEIGIDGYIIKPIDRNQLFKKLNKIAKNIHTYKKVKEYNELITIILNEQKESILLLNNDLSIKLYNNSFQKEMSKNINQDSSVIDILKNYRDIETDEPLTKEWFKSIKELKKTVVYKEYRKRKIFFQITAKRASNYIILSSTDITEIQTENIEYENRALKDQLTGVYNRHIIEKKTDEFTSKNVCVILLDIDDFKHINDKYGHPMGDMVLKTLARTLSQHTRDNDLVIRWGGEEFLIILNNMKNLELSKALAEKLRKTISKIQINHNIRFTASFGISCGFIEKRKELISLIKKSDKALYRAKKSGKNRVEL